MNGLGVPSGESKEISLHKICKYPPAEPVALRLLAPQRGLTATVEKQKQEQKQKHELPSVCDDIDRSRLKNRLP
jgi:hypothetical protein